MGRSSLASPRNQGNAFTGVQPWVADLVVGSKIRDYYDSRGSVTVGTATNLAATQDGPVMYYKFDNLSVNAVLSVPVRCRGLIIDCLNFTGGEAGGISMSGKGAQGQGNWPIEDLTIPNSLRLSADNIPQQTVLDYFRGSNVFLADPVFWAFPLADVGDCRKAAITPGTVLVSASGRGKGGKGVKTFNASNWASVPGNNGIAGNNSCGGGASGGIHAWSDCGTTGDGGDGYQWGGGQGGEGIQPNGGTVPRVSGYAGELSRCTQPGGVCLIIVRENLSLAAGFIAQSDGLAAPAQGSDSNAMFLGGPGAGAMRFFVGGTINNAATVRANGGLGYDPNSPTYKGGNGGNGIADVQSLSALGW